MYFKFPSLGILRPYHYGHISIIMFGVSSYKGPLRLRDLRFTPVIQILVLLQFTGMMDHGTRIVLYNLWEDDQGQLELDFDTDPNVSNSINLNLNVLKTPNTPYTTGG